MNIENPLTSMLGIKYPIIQGAIGLKGMSNSKIAVPVSEAGGLGMLTTISYTDSKEFSEDLKYIKKITDKPVAVNFTLMKGTDFNNEFHKEYVDICLGEGFKIAFTSAYDGSAIGKRFQDAGGVWIHKCATIKHAVSIAEKGADAVVIVGIEGTGFKSLEQNSTLINMTVASRLIKIPLIAAGGIANGAGFLSALSMGAAGVYLGTAFMATKEFQAPDKLKEKIVNQDVLDPKYLKRIYKMEHGAMHSLASGVIDSVKTVEDFINQIINESDEIINKFKLWKMFV